MKKRLCLFVIVISLLLAGSIYAQKVTYIQVGSYKPEATDGGLIISLGSAKEFDERVELGISLDLFMKEYTDNIEYIEEPMGPGLPPTTIIVTNAESRVTMVPLTAGALVKFPIEFPIIPYVGGSIGYTFLWYGFDNYQTDESEHQFFGGFTYRVQAGGMYPLGSKSAFLFELLYNNSKPSHKEETEAGLPTRNELDMSGLGIRVGFRLGGFGFF